MTTILLLLGMIVLIPVAGGLLAWPVLFGRNEYFVSGLAGVIGFVGAVVLLLTGNGDILLLIGDSIPVTTRSLVGVLAAGAPGVILLGRMLDSDNQLESVRHRYDPNVPEQTSSDDMARFVRTGKSPSQPSVSEEQSDPSDDTHSSERPESNQQGGPQTPPETREAGSEGSADFEYCWENETDVSFADVGGMDELKKELRRDVIIPMTSGRDAADRMNISVPNLLLHGPPGTGKTFLARALATELGCRFVKLSGADLQSKWINESPTKIKTLFEEAKRIATQQGGAVIFLDELDSVLASRGGTNGHAEDDKVVNEFLNQLQSTDEHDILFVGATNRLDSLDEASIRAGRIDKKIHVGKPDQNARQAILEAQLDDRPHSLTDDQLEQLARDTAGDVAADLEALIDDAARKCAFERQGRRIQWCDIESVL